MVDTSLPGWLQPYKQDSTNFHTESTLEKALMLIESGESLASICRDHDDMPEPHFLYRWFRRNEYWEKRYEEAKHISAEMHADKTIDYAEGKDANGNDVMEDVQRSALKVKAAQWLAMKLNPDKYGDKKQVDVNNTIRLDVVIDEGLKRVEHGRVIEHGEHTRGE